MVAPGGTLTYTVVLDNTGPGNAPAVRMTDTVPLSTTYVTGSLDYPLGAGGYDAVREAITWTGAVAAGLPVTLTFQVAVDPDAADGSVVSNTAVITGDGGQSYERTAFATVNAPPRVEMTDPAAADTGVPLTAPVVITFSEPVSTGSLQITVTPDPGGWQASWSEGDQIVALSHDGLAYSTVYTVAVAAEDLDGFSLVPGPAPNPWSFATEARVYFRVYLPLLLRSGR
jgi:uncharacterized repeat protein (TIGR01451 family)